MRAEIVVDLAAVRANVATLRRRVGVPLMAVVKADGYGHGMVPVARAARAGGAEWLGAAVLEEALALREAGDEGRILTWLTVPGEDYRPAVEQGIDLTAYTVEEADEVAAAARSVGRTARLQLKVDTGLSRGGSTAALWPALVGRAAALEESGDVLVTGVWSHLACADEPGHPANDSQERAFREALAVAEDAGLAPEVRHLANSAGALYLPGARFDLVRTGLAIYGLAPAPAVDTAEELGLVPAMSVRAELAAVKRIPAGQGVSYGHTYHVERDSTVAVVPVGYADGVPRNASSKADVLVGGTRRRVAGRVCMDQFVVDVGDDDVSPGDPVVLFGSGAAGEPTAQDWADACDTISYEIVSRVGGRMSRRYEDGT